MSNLILICHPSGETNARMLWKFGLVEANEVRTNSHLDPGQAFVIDMDVVEEGFRIAYAELQPTFRDAFFARVWGDV